MLLQKIFHGISIRYLNIMCIIFLYLAGTLYLQLALGVVYKLHIVLKVQNSHLRDVDMVAFSKAPSAARYDRIYLDNFQIYIVAFFVVPIRLLLLSGLWFSLLIWINITRQLFGKIHVEEVTDENGKKRKNHIFEKEQSTLYWVLLRGGISFLCKLQLLVSAFWSTKKKLKVSDFLADYGKYEEKNKENKAPIMISNHITGMDYQFYTQEYDMPSFMVVDLIKNFPLIGTGAESIQSIFLSKHSQEAKEKAVQDINDRVNELMEHRNVPRILIFPEGANNNGQEQMKFKVGAFENFHQLTIQCISFKGPFTSSFNLTNVIDTYLLQLTQQYHFIDLYELDTFDPQYTLDRHGITKDDPEAIDLVIKDVRYLYEYAFGMIVERNTSFAEKMELERHCYEMKNGLPFEPRKVVSRSDRRKPSSEF